MKKIIPFVCIILHFSVGYGQYTAQDRAEKSVKEHLVKTFTKENYKSFGFEELYKTTPSEIIEVEELKQKVILLRKNGLLTDSSLAHYDSLTSVKVEEVKAKKLFSTYDIKHYFVTKNGETNTLNYYNFELFPDGKIKDVKQLMKFDFVGNEYDWFYNYYRRVTVLPNSSEENSNCYLYLDNLVKSDTLDREATMQTVIATHATISHYTFLDTVIVHKVLTQNWLRRNISPNIKIKQYSEVKSITDKSEKIGSNIFLEYELNGEKNAYYFEFDVNYVLRGAMIVTKPYEEYFKK